MFVPSNSRILKQSLDVDRSEVAVKQPYRHIIRHSVMTHTANALLIVSKARHKIPMLHKTEVDLDHLWAEAYHFTHQRNLCSSNRYPKMTCAETSSDHLTSLFDLLDSNAVDVLYRLSVL